MPNWVTTRVVADEKVIRAILNSEGAVDFNTLLPFPGPHRNWDTTYCSAHEAAELVCGNKVAANATIANLQRLTRSAINIGNFSAPEYQQFLSMLQNYRACGYLTETDFSKDVWGTKWNAANSYARPEKGLAYFDTPWSCPKKFLIYLSKGFPNEKISVAFADEDIGYNCGSFVLQNGEELVYSYAPRDSGSISEGLRKDWVNFARDIIDRRRSIYKLEQV